LRNKAITVLHVFTSNIVDDYTGEEITLAAEYTHANNKPLSVEDFQLLKVRLHEGAFIVWSCNYSIFPKGFGER
jgi:hypothetical protein